MLELTERAPVMLSTRHLTAGCLDEVMFFASSEVLLLIVQPDCVLVPVAEAAATLLWQDPIVYFLKRLLFYLFFELRYTACRVPLSLLL